MSLYSWGANSHGQLGLGYANELCMTPQKVPRISFKVNNVRSIKGGGGHVLVLDSSGRIHCCGWNNRGQLGINCTEDKNEFTCIPEEYFHNIPITFIACGWDMSGAITRNRKVYVWGSNSFQQLGLCHREFPFIKQPIELILPRNEKVVEIAFGLRYTCMLTENNTIYIYGRFTSGDARPNINISQMGFNNTVLTKIKSDIKIDSIASGQKHLLLLLSNRHKIIGIGDNKFQQSNSFECDDVQHMKAGWTHNGILTKNKEIFLWGRNSYGQIGTSSEETVQSLTKLDVGDPIPQELHLGSEHGLVLTTCGKIFTWGWNEHGNCGTGSTENLFSPAVVDLPLRCTIAGTGAAFCFVVCE